jgi:predicted transposase/invertase (TIGR01784 family)
MSEINQSANIKELLDPKLDLVFKMIFANKKYPEIAVSFLNSILYPGSLSSKIISLEIDNSMLVGETPKEKVSILDVKVTTNNREIINIEIQLRNEYNIVKRCVYYGSRLINSQLVQGEDYSTLKKSIVICIINYPLLYDETAIHNRFLLKNAISGKVLTDLLEIHYLELSKLINPNLSKDESWYPWMLFLNNPKSEVLQMAKRSIPELEKALALLEELSADKELQNLYEARIKDRLDRGSALAQAKRDGLAEGLEQGIEAGRQQEKHNNAINFYHAGVPLETIASSLKISLDELNLFIKSSF